MKPHVHVACAIIEHDGLVLAAQRSEGMNLPLKWEFPGGKLEAGETPGECVIRELHEELAVRVGIGPVVSGLAAAYIAGIITRPARTIIILNARKLLSSTERLALAEMGEAR